MKIFAGMICYLLVTYGKCLRVDSNTTAPNVIGRSNYAKNY